MAFTLVTTQTIIARNAGGLYNLEVGTANMTSYVAQATAVASIDAFLNTVYTNSVGTASTADVAAAILANVGIPASTVTGSAGQVALDYVVAQLNAVASFARGAVVNKILSDFSTLTANAVYGTYATAYNTKVANALTYATVAGNADSSFSAVSSSVLGTTFTLTTGLDNITGTSGNDTFNGTIGNIISGGVLIQAGTLTGLDALNGGAGTNVLNFSDIVGSTALPGGLSISNIQTVNSSSVGAATEDFTTGFTGLTAVNVTTSTGADVISVGSGVAVSVTDTAGSVTLAGGLTQTVTTAGGYALSGSIGAIKVTDTAQAAVASTINGGTDVNLTTTTTSTGTITIGGTTKPTGAITVIENLSGTGALTGGAVKITGGSTVALTINSTQATVNTTTTAGAVTITGGATTTAVSVTETKAVTAAAKVAGIANGAITVTDANYGSTTAGTISSVTASGYTTLNINDSALTTLSIANGSSNIIIDNSDAVTTHITTLAVTVNGLTGGTLDDADVYKTINVTTATANSTLANCTFGGATTLTVAGTNTLTLNSAAGMSALKTITVTGSAGLTANTGIAGTVTSIDASGTSGNNSVTINPAVATYKGGTGVDTVTISTAAPTLAINGGAGTADELVLNLAAGTLANPSGNSFISGFETLGFGAAATGTYNGTGFTTIHFGSASVTGAVTVNQLAAGTALLIDADPSQDVTYTLADPSGTADAVHVTIGKVSVASTALAGKNVTVSGIETINLTAVGDGTGTDTILLVDTSAKSLVIDGGSATTVTLAGATALATVDAHAATGLVNISGVALGTSGATVTSGAGGITAAAGVGADTFVLTGSTTAVDTIKFADGSAKPVVLDTVKGFTNFATGTVAGDLSDHLVFTTNAPAALHANVTVATTVPTPLDTQVVIPVNVNYTTLNGILTFGGSGLSSATLAQLIGGAESIVDNSGIDQVLAFQYSGDTIVVHSQHVAITSSAPGNAADSVDHDSVIQLVGVTGLTSIDVTGAAAGAHVLLIA